MMSEVAAYEKITAALREQIQSGQLKPNDRLPSTSELCALFGVSYGTLRSAILVLKAERLVVGRQGIGVFVASQDTEPVA